MNFSAILINIALRNAQRAQKTDAHAVLSIEVAVVFAVMALEALLNEQAYIQTVVRERLSVEVYQAVDRGAQGFERIQAVLLYLFQAGLEDGKNPANDLKVLMQIRNGFVHYRFERPPKKALDHLADSGRFDPGWEKTPISWPSFGTKGLAKWAYETVCDTANEIADILENVDEHSEAAIVRNNFDPSELQRLLDEESTDG